jgi:hypothetical protein
LESAARGHFRWFHWLAHIRERRKGVEKMDDPPFTSWLRWSETDIKISRE